MSYDNAVGWDELPIPNSFVHKLCSNGAVDAPADGSDDTACWAADFSDPRNFFTNKFFLVTALAEDMLDDISTTIVQLVALLQILRMKRPMTSLPRVEWVTSGWNWMP